MKKTLKLTASVLGVVALCYFSYLGAVIFAAPSIPPSNFERFMALEQQLDALVDQHWSRADAVPTGDEIAGYRKLIDELNKFHYAPLMRQHEWALAQLPSAQERMLSSSHPFMNIYYSLSPIVAENLAIGAAYAIAGASMYTHHYYYEHVQLSRLLTSRMINLRSDARYHLAMALIFANDNQGAIDQLLMVSHENPDQAQIYGMFTSGARAHAEENPDFVSALSIVGVRRQWFVGLTDKEKKMRPWRGNKLYDSR